MVAVQVGNDQTVAVRFDAKAVRFERFVQILPMVCAGERFKDFFFVAFCVGLERLLCGQDFREVLAKSFFGLFHAAILAQLHPAAICLHDDGLRHRVVKDNAGVAAVLANGRQHFSHLKCAQEFAAKSLPPKGRGRTLSTSDCGSAIYKIALTRLRRNGGSAFILPGRQ